MYQICVQSLLYCGLWWITDLLLLSSWVFRHLMKLRWSAAHWHFGSHLNYDYVGVRYRQHRKDGRRLTQNQRSFIPHRFPCTSPRFFSRVLWSCLQCGCLWDLSAAYPWAVLPEARKVSKAVSTLRKFQVWNCRTANSSPIIIWKAAATVAELNRRISRNAFKLKYMASPCSSKASDSHSEGVKCKSPLSLFFYVDVTAHMCLGGTWMSVDY